MRRLHMTPSGAAIETAAASTPGTVRTRCADAFVGRDVPSDVRSARRASITARSTRPRSKPSGPASARPNDCRNKPAQTRSTTDRTTWATTSPLATVTRPGGGVAAASILHRVDGHAARRADRGRHAEDERRGDRDRRGEREHATVERQLEIHGIRGELRHQETGCPIARRSSRRPRPSRRAAGFRSGAGAPAVRVTRRARGARSIRGCARWRGRAGDWRCWRTRSAARARRPPA